jgi:hypothetical protein
VKHDRLTPVEKSRFVPADEELTNEIGFLFLRED